MTKTLFRNRCGIVCWVCWLYVFLLLTIWGVIHVAGDRWWPATILLFSPRWVFALPLLLFVPLAIWRRNFFVLVSLLGATLVVFGPMMGLNLNKQRSVPRQTSSKVLRVVTYNVKDGQFNAEQFAKFLQSSAVDLLALQECPENCSFTPPRGWYGFKQAGLAIFSAYPFEVKKILQLKQLNKQWQATYLLHADVVTPHGVIAFCCLHLPSPRFGLQAVLDKHTILRLSRKRLLELQIVERRISATEVQKYLANISRPLLVVGDFNTPVESTIFREVWGGYHNAFSETGLGYGWTQRVAVRGLPFGARIDHVLTRNGLKPLQSVVGPDMGSDHLPLIADVAVDRR